MKNLDESTKKMLRTFGLLVGAVIAVFIILFIFMGLSGKKVGDTQLVNSIENAAKRYYAANKDKLPTKEGETVKVTTDTLISEKYLKSFDKLTKNTGCSGEVKVTNNGGEYLYNPSLKCSEYKTTTIKDKIESTLVNSGDGLYKEGSEYYYRGEYVDNYIKIANTVYRVVSIDKNGYVKVINPNVKTSNQQWDNRYNTELTANGVGVNDYEKSRLREFIDSYYEGLDAKTKAYIVKHNWCVGKRAISNTNFNANECNKTYNSFLGTLLPSEYARVSTDSLCKNIKDGACSNYNYLKKILPGTWTSIGVTDNTYEVMAFGGTSIYYTDASDSADVAIAFHISGNNLYVSGDGTEASPYVIR